VEVRAPVEAAVPLRDGCASFFSGGVDSSYTFLRHRDEVTHLVLIDGYDYRLENEALSLQACKGLMDFATAHARVGLVVQTNLRGLYEPRGIDALLYHGPMLAAVALLLGFPRTYIPATHTFLELMPWGSHVLHDPLWSTEATEIVHDGAEASRTDKVAAIADSPEVGRTLRVCFQNTAAYNCGVCEKCLRTRLALRLVGKRVETLAPLDSVEPVSRLRIKDEPMLAFFEDNLARAIAVGDRAAAAAVRVGIRRVLLRTALKDLDRVVLGGNLRRLYRRVARVLPGYEPEERRFSVRAQGR
jgi:7-cyano-7-deazaguanine synthase in queuosine biosynthesis